MFIFFPFQVSTSQVSTSARPRLVIPPSTRPRLSSFPGVVVIYPAHAITSPPLQVPIPDRDASGFSGIVVNPPDHEVPPSLQVILTSQILMVLYSVFSVYFLSFSGFYLCSASPRNSAFFSSPIIFFSRGCCEFT